MTYEMGLMVAADTVRWYDKAVMQQRTTYVLGVRTSIRTLMFNHFDNSVLHRNE